MGTNPAHLSVVAASSPDDDHESGSPGGPRRQRDESLGADGVDGDFVAVYKTHYPRLVRALELSGANRVAAEDVAQEAFARTLWHWQRVRRGTNPSGYVYRVAFRILRRDRNRRLPPIDASTTPDFATEVALSLEIERAIRAMPLAQRRCAVLCLVIGASTKDTARVLGIAQSTVRKQIERARSDLRQALETRS
jgi:RNA polymerase sigma factor (sigma-70 family)